MPRIRQAGVVEIADYTKRKLSVTVTVCPSCGRRGLERRYTYPKGDRAWFHVVKRGLFGCSDVTDACYVKATKES